MDPTDTGSEPETSLDASSFLEAVEGTEGQIDDPYVDIIAEYVEHIEPRLTALGWDRENAKTPLPPFYKYDMSMQTHTRTGVLFLLRLVGDLLPDEVLKGRSDRKTMLRELVALFVIHDFHKVRDVEGGWDEEFDIPRYEVEVLVDELGLDEFAPTLTMDDFHAVAVALHKSGNSKKEMVTRKVYNLHPILYVADAASSLNDVRDFASNRIQSAFAAGTRRHGVPHAHSISGPTGMTTSVLNKAAANAFESVGYDLLTIHEDGCSYVERVDSHTEFEEAVERETGELPIDADELLDLVYDEFLKELRKAFPQSRNRAVLAGATKMMHRQGKYQLTPLDLLILPRRDYIRAIVERGINQSSAPFDLPEYALTDIEALEAETGVEFSTVSYRIEGIARIVHTVYEQIVQPLVTIARENDADEMWRTRSVPALMSAFNTSVETQRTIQDLWTTYTKQVGGRRKFSIPNTETPFPIKYLIAQDVMDRDGVFDGEQPSETVEIITDLLNRWVNTHFEAEWQAHVDDEVAIIDEELQTYIYDALEFDGRPVKARPVSPSLVERFAMRDGKHECELCGNKTKAGNDQKLIDTATELDVDVEFEGETVNLQQAAYRGRFCYWCQLDISLHAQDTAWPDSEDDDTTDLENRLHVVSRPDYAYMPLSGILFSHVLDQYSAVGAKKGVEFATDVFNQDSSNEEWMKIHAQNAFGRAILSDFDRAFMLGTGYGAHYTNLPLVDGDETEALFTGVFAGAVAGMQAGLSAYISPRPVLRPPAEQVRELIHLSEELRPVFNIFGGSRLPLKTMAKTVRAVGAMRRLTDAAGHGHAPVDAFLAFNRNRNYPLVGSAMFHKAVTEGEDPTEYATEALVLDAFATKDKPWTNDMHRLALKLADHAYMLLDEPDDHDAVVSVIKEGVDYITGLETLPEAPHLREAVLDHLEATTDVDLTVNDLAPEYAREFTARLVDVGVNDLAAGRSQRFAAIAPEVVAGSVPAVVSLTAGDRRPYEAP